MIDSKSFELLMNSEGGLNENEPASVGGVSYAGISQKTYDSWRQSAKCQIPNAPTKVKDLAGTAIGTVYEKRNPLEIPTEHGVRVDVIKAFYVDYLEKSYIELLPECLQYIHMDFFVNAGYTANKVVQKILGFSGKEVDGILGRGSRAKLKEFTANFATELELNSYADNDLIDSYDNLKLEHYESLKEKNEDLYNANIRGWKVRANHVKAELIEYYQDDDPTPSAVDETEDVDVAFEEVEAPSNSSNPRLDILEESVKDIQNNMVNIQNALQDILKNPPKKGFFQNKVLGTPVIVNTDN